jgi:hypothetical protein
MKTKDLNKNITDLIFKEVKRKIIQESEGSKKEVYHIKCEGVPLATFDTKEEAEEALPDYSDKHTGDLIIEKGVYDSHDDMMEKLDQLNDELDEEVDATEGNEFTGELAKAKAAGEDTFTVDGKEYDVEEGEECMECGDKNMTEKLHGDQHKLDKDKDGKLTKKDFLMMLQNKNSKKEDIDEAKNVCNECGSKLNEEGNCSECYDKKEMSKKSIKLKESQMIEFIKKIVKESVPGIDVTKKMQSVSKKSNEDNIKDVSNKIKKSMSISGNDNPEFPKQIGKGKEKQARQNTKEEDDIVADTRGGGLEDLNYDNEPSDAFKKRLKMALEGDALMGNSQEYANVVKSDVGKKLADKAERKDKKIKSEPKISWGHSWKSPEEVIIVKENKINMSSLLEEEIKKIKNISNYNKKTQ